MQIAILLDMKKQTLIKQNASKDRRFRTVTKKELQDFIAKKLPEIKYVLEYLRHK